MQISLNLIEKYLISEKIKTNLLSGAQDRWEYSLVLLFFLIEIPSFSLHFSDSKLIGNLAMFLKPEEYNFQSRKWPRVYIISILRIMFESEPEKINFIIEFNVIESLKDILVSGDIASNYEVLLMIDVITNISDKEIKKEILNRLQQQKFVELLLELRERLEKDNKMNTDQVLKHEMVNYICYLEKIYRH